jgi:hypothetical protein
MILTSFISIGGLALWLAAPPIFAHHSFSMEFDSTMPVTFKGAVTKVDWRNPHAYVYVTGKDERGRTANWIFETVGPAGLARSGWHRDSVRVGDNITVYGYRSRAGLNIASARLVVLMDGQKLTVGSAYDGGPQSNGGRQ